MMFNRLYKSFIRVKGYLLLIISIGITLLLFFIVQKIEVPMLWVVVFAIPFLLLFIVVCDVAHCATQDIILPKVKASCEPHPLYSEAHAILLLEKSKLFGHESMVSVYFKEDDFEILIGLGYVLTIQQEGSIQVLITTKVGAEKDDIWEKVRDNNSSILRKLLIRPTIPKILQSFGA